MGMSASQARFLSLTARKTNTEYEGQQINQQRTALSNESSNYYSQLTSMTVPTPPNSADYTKVTYTFVNGTEKNTITSLVATAETAATGIYKLNYTQEIPVDTVIVNGTSQADKLENATSETDPSKITMSEADMRAHFKQSIPEAVVNSMTVNEMKNKLAVEAQYRAMAVEKYGDENWKVMYRQNIQNGSYEPIYFSVPELERMDYSQKTGLSLGGLKVYEFGQSTETREFKNKEARIDQDASGRYISMFLYDDQTHTVGTRYDLTTTTVSDEAGYQDAMNQYYYDKAIYDEKVQEVNAKIEIIQVQDKNLELKLKQLDTEQNAISTEMDAVKKVISKNVESSFKTFNA